MIEIERLRAVIPNVLAKAVKAYELPAVCTGFGLAPGEESEAYGSKRIYVRSRIAGLDVSSLIELGRRIQERFSDADLEEALHLATESGQSRVSELTRRRILERIAQIPDISGRLSLLDFLGRVFTLRQYLSEDIRFGTLADEIEKHMIQNDDWELGYLFDRLGLISCSEYRFIQFLELCLHPMVRDGAEQAALARDLNALLKPDGQVLVPVDTMSGEPVYRLVSRSEGVEGTAKNLIFAANGPKPDIILQDAINNDVRIVKNEEYCLVYDRSFGVRGLTWGDLVNWWSDKQGIDDPRGRQAEEELYQRLWSSLASQPEKVLFRRYFEQYRGSFGWDLPALIPQVYLHYDPYTARLRRDMAVLSRQRMDFLILFSPQERVVIEIDGKHHYSSGDIASPTLYSEMVAADRELRLIGYEVYRFGAAELTCKTRNVIIDSFFDRLFLRHGVSK